MHGNKQYILMIMDGVGLNDESKENAFKLANTPNLDKLIAKYPNTYIATSGMAVGLPEGQMGNSEVGHTNIGAGRIVYQDLTRITKEINDGDFFKNEEFLTASLEERIEAARKIGNAGYPLGFIVAPIMIYDDVDYELENLKNNQLQRLYKL